jgi:hypothetical protein
MRHREYPVSNLSPEIADRRIAILEHLLDHIESIPVDIHQTQLF